MQVVRAIVTFTNVPLERLRFDPDPWGLNQRCSCPRCRRREQLAEMAQAAPVVGGFPLLEQPPAVTDPAAAEAAAGLKPLPPGWPLLHAAGHAWRRAALLAACSLVGGVLRRLWLFLVAKEQAIP